MKVDNGRKIIDNKLFLSDKSRFDNKSVVQVNQTTDKAVTYSRFLNNYVENSGFPDFVEVIR
jgi:hypothetical protein cdiviTM7_01413